MKFILSILAIVSLCACENFKTNAVPLAELGLSAAVAKGVIKPGDAVLVSKGIAVITSEDSNKTKALKLADIGLDKAVASGRIDPGDKLLIDSATAIISKAPEPPGKNPSL